jgi:hypothetical protein
MSQIFIISTPARDDFSKAAFIVTTIRKAIEGDLSGVIAASLCKISLDSLIRENCMLHMAFQQGMPAAFCISSRDDAGNTWIGSLLKLSGSNAAPRACVAQVIVSEPAPFYARVRVFPEGRFFDRRGHPLSSNIASMSLFKEFEFELGEIQTHDINRDEYLHLSTSAEWSDDKPVFRSRVLRSSLDSCDRARRFLQQYRNLRE